MIDVSKVALRIARSHSAESAPEKKKHHDLVPLMKKWADDNKDLRDEDPKKYSEEMAKELQKHGWDRNDYIAEFKKNPRSVLKVVNEDTHKMIMNQLKSDQKHAQSALIQRRVVAAFMSAGLLRNEAVVCAVRIG